MCSTLASIKEDIRTKIYLIYISHSALLFVLFVLSLCRCGRNLTCDVVALCTLVSGRTVFVCGVVESVGISQGVG